MRTVLAPVLLLLLLLTYGLLMPEVWDSREQARAEVPAGYVIPTKFSRILALGQQGVLSDFLFLKTATFIGSRGLSRQMLTDEDWNYVKESLNVVTDLDPYFVDPYTLAEGLLAWDAGKPGEANKLLKKGMEYRTWDWRLPYYIGFNEFYFLKNYKDASGYIMRAAELPGSPAYLKTLGARLAYYGGKSQTALLFLKEILADASDPLLKKRLELRLTALERAVDIESALTRFKEREKRLPNKLAELVTSGDLAFLPEDPYGGKWGILKNGRVYSTSKFVEIEPPEGK